MDDLNIFSPNSDISTLLMWKITPLFINPNNGNGSASNFKLLTMPRHQPKQSKPSEGQNRNLKSSRASNHPNLNSREPSLIGAQIRKPAFSNFQTRQTILSLSILRYKGKKKELYQFDFIFSTC